MVWVNDEQNSRLINFIPELLSPFARNTYRYAKKRPWKAETGIKDCFEEMEHKMSVWISRLAKQEGCLFRRSIAPGYVPLKLTT